MMFCHSTILVLGTSSISLPKPAQNKDTTDSVKSASYLDPHLEIDTRGTLNTKIYEKRDDFDFPIVNFSFLSGNVPAAPAY